VDEDAACHGLAIGELELEDLLYEVISKQAQVILNLKNLSDVGQLEVQLAEQAEYGHRMENCLDEKRVLYEQLVLQKLSIEDYKTQKAAIDVELERLRKIYSGLKARTSQIQMDEQEKCARTELAQEAAGVGGLTSGLADALIDRVYIYPGNQVEIVWKIKNFCAEGL